MNIYVGNMSYNMNEDQLRETFEAYGEVTSVNIISDRNTGQPRGFAFVEMADDGQASAAIEGLHGKDVGGRTLNVSEARPRKDR